MTKFVRSTFVLLLIGLVRRACVDAAEDELQAADDIWLNEIHVFRDPFTVEIELVGRPKSTGADAPQSMAAKVSFYGSTADPVAEAEVTLSADAAWSGNYVTTETLQGAVSAFPTDTPGGAVLEFGTTEVVYCWLTDEGSTIGGGKTCGKTVRSDSMTPSDDGHSKASGLYGGSSTPADGGTGEEHFEWKQFDGAEANKEFHTIGDLNTCPDGAACIPQTIDTWTFTDTTQVWLNEIDVDLADSRVRVEVLGRPTGSECPDTMEVTMQFYDAQAVKGELHSLALVADEEFVGNYAMTGCFEDVNGAFPSGALGGVVVTYGGLSIAYCWGATGGSIGGLTCGRIIRTGGFESTTPNSGLYNDVSTPDEGGTNEKDFKWHASTLTSPDGFFSSLGKINGCPSDPAGTCSLSDQELVRLGDEPEEPEVPPTPEPNNDVVWLNELDVLGAASAADVKVSLELVGRPVEPDQKKAGEAYPPPSLVAEVTFYDGSGATGAVKEVTLTSESQGSWKGNYMGSLTDEGGYGEAFPSGDDAAGGLKVTHDAEQRVYCWGKGAEVGKEIGGPAVKCQSVVATVDMNADGQQTNMAMWNTETTPDKGGTKGGDFEWEKSESSGGAFETIGHVNACPPEGDCGETKDQVLATFDDRDDGAVWLNELDVVVGTQLQDKKVSVELVGRPVEVSEQDPPESITAVVTFYDGSEVVDVPKTVTLSPRSDCSWNGNYVGSFKGEESYGAAFTNTGVAGLKLEHEGEKRVYCWGPDAEVDVGIDTAGDVRCQSVVTTSNTIETAEARTNIAMWNKDKVRIGGRKGDDFVWGLSVDRSGDEDVSFATIDRVNTCPRGGDCATTNQVLATFDWQPTTSTTSTSGSVAPKIAAVLVLSAALTVAGYY